MNFWRRWSHLHTSEKVLQRKMREVKTTIGRRFSCAVSSSFALRKSAFFVHYFLRCLATHAMAKSHENIRKTNFQKTTFTPMACVSVCECLCGVYKLNCWCSQRTKTKQTKFWWPKHFYRSRKPSVLNGWISPHKQNGKVCLCFFFSAFFNCSSFLQKKTAIEKMG